MRRIHNLVYGIYRFCLYQVTSHLNLLDFFLVYAPKDLL